jgi:hypothetical protein
MSKNRLGLAVALAAALSIGLSGIAAADTVQGQHGDYLFTDDSSHAGANCGYVGIGNGTWQLSQFSVRPPSVWWPDTSSDSDTQHGPVGWRVVVFHKHAAATTWSKLKQSTIQQKTAYEDQPAYDPADKAPFTRIKISVPAGNYGAGEQYRVNVRAIWFHKPYNGTVTGYAVHTVQNYNRIVDGFNQGLVGTAYCVGRFNAD